MQPPDSNTWLLILLNTCGWVVMWFKKSGVSEFQHNMMWEWFRKTHINGKDGKVIKEA